MPTTSNLPNPPAITLLGLGPGDAALITRQAWQVLESASEVYLRTRQHPLVADLPPHLVIHSFDDLYETSQSFEDVYAQIVEKVLDLGKRPGGVVYAVPGHPFVAEATCPEIARRAKQEGLSVLVVEGLSFLEPTFTALGLDPLPKLALVDALDVARAQVPSFPPDAPAIIAQIHAPEVASDVKLTLMEVYPDEHPVRLVHAAGSPQERVEDLPLYQIDRSPHIGLLTCLYVPPLGEGSSFEAFQEVIARLRAPDGCPWDREQTHQSLRTHLLEETYEALSALDADDPHEMQEEFGDLLLQIVLHAQIASEYCEFNMADVVKGIHDKIIRRHPHVFGDWKADSAAHVLQNWEKLKAAEREQNGEQVKGMLDGVAAALPALNQAQEYQARAVRAGYDWTERQSLVTLLDEECLGDYPSGDEARQVEAIGKLLFSMVNLARMHNVDAESALRETNTRFKRGFSALEAAARQQGKALAELPADMDALWQADDRQGQE